MEKNKTESILGNHKAFNLENGTEFLRNILNMIRQNQQINVVLNGLTLNNSKKN